MGGGEIHPPEAKEFTMAQYAEAMSYIPKKGEDVQFKRGLFVPEQDSAESYNYGVYVSLSSFYGAGAARKYYGLYIGGDQNYAVTGDSNSAMIRCSGNNYAANDSNYVYRGLNIAAANRSGGTLGRMEHSAGVQNKSGGTAPYLLVFTMTSENYGTCATEMGVADFIHRNEAAAPTLTYGIRIRNDDRSGVSGAVGSAINITSHASSGGFTRLINAEGAVLTEYDSGTKVCLMSFQGANGVTYYLLHDTDAATAVSVNTSLA
jgi:hypothetical protein